MRIEGFQGGFLPLNGGALSGPLTIVGAPVYGVFTEVSGSNAGAVTVSVSYSTIVSLNLGNVAVGDRIEAFGFALYPKGVTAGRSSLQFLKNGGTATIVSAGVNSTPTYEIDTQSASSSEWLEGYGVFEVTGAGSLTLDMQGRSTGSDSVVAVGTGRMIARVFRKQ